MNTFLSNIHLFQENNNDSYVVVNQRNSFGYLASMRVIWTTIGQKAIYGVYERPPFPIIIDTPTLRDVMQNMQASDFVFSGTVYSTGLLVGYGLSRPLPYISQRLLVYHGLSHITLFTAACLMFVMPYRRLTGYWDNGLRWRKPENKLNKYDNTSHFEKATIWGKFKINSQ